MIVTMLDNLRVAWTGLRANKLRSGLTMLGVIIGVAAVVALLSIGEGARTFITERISSAGTNLLFVSPGAVAAGPVRGPMGSASTLTLADARAVADSGAVRGVAAVAPQFGRATQVAFGDANAHAEVIGVTPDHKDVFDLRLAGGRFVEERDVERRVAVAVIGSDVARDLFGGFHPLGRRIKVTLPGTTTRVALEVVGVLEQMGGSIISNTDGSVLVPISTAQSKLFSGRNVKGEFTVSRISVEAVSQADAELASEDIAALLRARHDIGPDQDDDFVVVTQSEMLAMAGEVTRTMTVFLGAIAGISLLVGGIGIMNIMLVSVTERTREVGLRKAVGARRSDILAQFLLESITLSGLGGVVGVGLGAATALLVTRLDLIRAVPSLPAVGLALAAALAVGLFFGIYPANRAASLSPIEALRHE